MKKTTVRHDHETSGDLAEGDCNTGDPKKVMSFNEAMDSVFNEMMGMTDKEFNAMLEKSKDSPLYQALLYAWEGMEEFDRCVICGARTKYKKTTHIDKRKHYKEGAGQLCPGCDLKIYGK